MKLIIHARHAALAEDFSQLVEEKINSLERFSVLIERIEVEILHEANPRQGKHAHHVIITTHGAGPLMRAEAQSFNDLAAKMLKTFGQISKRRSLPFNSEVGIF